MGVLRDLSLTILCALWSCLAIASCPELLAAYSESDWRYPNPIIHIPGIPHRPDGRVALADLPADVESRVILHIESASGHFKLVVDGISFDGRVMRRPFVRENTRSVRDGIIITFPGLSEAQITNLRNVLLARSRPHSDRRRFDRTFWTCVDGACQMMRDHLGIEIADENGGSPMFAPDGLRAILEHGFRNTTTGATQPIVIYSTVAPGEPLLHRLDLVSHKRQLIRLRGAVMRFGMALSTTVGLIGLIF